MYLCNRRGLKHAAWKWGFFAESEIQHHLIAGIIIVQTSPMIYPVRVYFHSRAHDIHEKGIKLWRRQCALHIATNIVEP